MEHVTLHDSGEGIVVMTADRAPANAMDVTLLGDILQAVEQVASDLPRALKPSCGLNGAGPRAAYALSLPRWCWCLWPSICWGASWEALVPWRTTLWKA